MQENTIKDTSVDSTAQRLPYSAPTLEELGTVATAGKLVLASENASPGLGS